MLDATLVCDQYPSISPGRICGADDDFGGYMRLLTAMTAISLVLAVPGGALLAQERVSPELSARIDGVSDAESEALRLEQLNVSVVVHGSLAYTEMTAKFANPSNETLEGNFVLALPKGSVVTGYALDVEGRLIDGVLQPRDKARQAYEDRVAGAIDPGLAEVDFSDKFETRVYPILPRNGRTIRVRFVSPLDSDLSYLLPLENSAVGAYSIEVSGVRPAGRTGFRWENEGLTWRAEGTDQIDGRISFKADRDDTLVVSQHPGEGKFFELSGRAPAPAVPDKTTELTILWDRSVSRLDDDVRREAEIASNLAAQLGVDEVTIHVFDSISSETATVPATNLRRELRRVRYVGGTSYAGLAEAIKDTSGLCVLFTDGRVTIGDRESLPSAGCRIVTMSSGPEVDRAWLSGQARLTGSDFVDLKQVNNREAIAAILRPSSMPKALDSTGNAIEIVSLPESVGRFRIAGPVPVDGVVVLNGEQFLAPRGTPQTFRGPGALWAQQHLALNRDTLGTQGLAQEARRWSIAVPGVSFIVLETPEDYAQSDFVPPDNYPKNLRSDYDELRAEIDGDQAEREEEHLARVRSSWEDRKEWWARKIDSRATYAEGASEEAEAAAEEPLAEPPPPAEVGPSPVSIPEVSEEAIQASASVSPVGAVSADSYEDSGDYIVVTGSRIVAPEPEPGLGSITVREWSADRPYIATWDEAGDNWLSVVEATEKEQGTIPLFYLDLAEWHFKNGRALEARKAALAALELPTRDNQTVEIVAQRLLRYGDFDGAIWLLERLVDREGDRPQPSMALAQAFAARGRATDTRADVVQAQEIMAEVGLKLWPERYELVNEIALGEANALVTELGGADAVGVTLASEFIADLPVDVRVVAVWNTPRTDLDLWVREPSGTDVGFSNQSSTAGGRYTHDLTQGHGPEEYMIRRAPDGTYRIEVNTFSADRLNPNGPSVVTVRLIRDFGTPTQREETIDVEMVPDEDDDRRFIGEIVVE